jgi:hypothetical protein
MNAAAPVAGGAIDATKKRAATPEQAFFWEQFPSDLLVNRRLHLV